MSLVEVTGLYGIVGAVLFIFSFSYIATKLNWFKNVKRSTGQYDFENDKLGQELKKQTAIMEKDYNDRISGWRQNYDKWK